MNFTVRSCGYASPRRIDFGPVSGKPKGSGVISDCFAGDEMPTSPFRGARRPNLSGPVSFRPRLQDNIESPSAGTDNPLERAKFIPIVLRIFVAADG